MNQEKLSIFEQTLEDHSKRTYLNEDGSERNGGDDKIIDVFYNFVKSHIKLAKVAGFEGWQIKNAKEYHKFGWDMYYLRALERDGKIKLMKTGKSKYSYLITDVEK